MWTLDIVDETVIHCLATDSDARIHRRSKGRGRSRVVTPNVRRPSPSSGGATMSYIYVLPKPGPLHRGFCSDQVMSVSITDRETLQALH